MGRFETSSILAVAVTAATIFGAGHAWAATPHFGAAPKDTSPASSSAAASSDPYSMSADELVGALWIELGLDDPNALFALGPVPGGEDCSTATVIPALPFSGAGSTVGLLDDTDEVCPFADSTAPDVVYAFTPVADQTIDISLCGNSDFDTKLYVYENTCTPGTPVACNDDACSTPSFADEFVSSLTVTVFAGNTYYIVIDGYGEASGNYTIDVGEFQFDCDPAKIAEGEPVCTDEYVDLYNAGCNGTPATFTDIALGAEVCGEAGTFLVGGGNSRDTDWYRFTLAEETIVTWRGTAEFPLVVGLIDTGGVDDCAGGLPFLVSDTAIAGVEASASATLAAGTWYAFAAPDTFDGVPCGSSYAVDLLGISTLECDPGTILEGEPVCVDDYIDDYNGGCNSTPNVFIDIVCGDRICGEAGNFLMNGVDTFRDTDWYRVTLNVETEITWSGTAEFELLVGIVDTGGDPANCTTSTLISDTAPPGETASVTMTLTPGIWFVALAPANFEGTPCGSTYVVELTCQSADVAIDKSVSNGTPFEGEEIVYTVTATNTGAIDATSVIVDDLLPAGVTFIQVDSVTQGSYDDVLGVWNVGTLIDGTPAILDIRASVDAGTVGTTGTGAFIDVFASGSGLTMPVGVAFGPDGNLYVTSSTANEVLRFDGTTGVFIDVFASGGGLDFGSALAFGPDRHLYVSSNGSGQVLRYNGTTGTFIGVFASGGGLDGPTGLAFDAAGNLYVASSGTNEVLRYAAGVGLFIDVFASGGGLTSPQDIRFGPDGHLYVASLTDEVLRFDGASGAFIDVFASGGGLISPSGVRFGPDGRFYVGSYGTGEVLRFDAVTGAFIDVFATGGGLDGPVVLAFGPDGNLYVASRLTDQVLRYQGFITNVASLAGIDQNDANGLNDQAAIAITVQEITGSCCQSGGVCTVESEDDCNGMEGAYGGDGTTCDPFPCPVKCCLPDGSCGDLTEVDCAAQGGQADLPGSSCFSDGGLCPPPGACCFGDGTCLDLPEFGCDAALGTYQGELTSCAVEGCSGACCFFPSGSCGDFDIAACASGGGSFEGFGTECASTVCPGTPGACCFGDTCTETTQDDCINVQAGVFIGIGTLCIDDPCPRRCCLSDGSCQDVSASVCAGSGGQSGPLSSNCATATCPQPGSCCFDDDTCQDVADFSCAAQGGVFIGEGTACAVDGCQGACCLPDGMCVFEFESSCVAGGGAYQGNNDPCSPNPCMEACCLPDGTCFEVTADDCTLSGGAPQGLGLACIDVICTPIGACCLGDATCSIQTQDDCAISGGTYVGDATTCEEGVCPGACCFTDGTCGFITPAACAGAGNGFYKGDGVSCATEPCPARGACCMFDGTCTFTFAIACPAVSGVFRGVGIPCFDFACPDPGEVLNDAKIADGVGGFTGFLNTNASFGDAVAGLGDLNGDGVREIVVGAPTPPIPGDGSLFTEGGVWILSLHSDGSVGADVAIGSSVGGLEALDPADRFGGSVTALGDLDGDDIVDIAVGAPGDDDNDDGLTGDTDHGAVWILLLNANGSVKAAQKISEVEGGFTGSLAAFDQFGSSATGIGDLDGDSVPDVAVGAPGTDDEIDEGAVWILLLNPDGTVKGHTKIGPDTGFGGLAGFDEFGFSIAALGDLDDDGVNDLAVGAPGDDDGGPGRGAVWVVLLNSDGTVKASSKISDSAGGFLADLDDFDAFGTSVAGLGDLDGDGVGDLGIGTPFDDDGGANRGAVWIILLLPDGTVRFERKISDTESNFDGVLADGDQFGSGLAVIGDLNADGVTEMVVGASGDETGGLNHGAAWVLFLDGDADIVFADPTGFAAAGDLNAAAIADLDTAPSSIALSMGAGPSAPVGTPDVAVLLPDDGLVQIFLNAGTDETGQWLGFLNVDPPLTFNAGPTPTSIALGRFNADDYIDIAIANGAADTVTILFNAADDSGTFPFDVTIPGFGDASAIAAANFVGNTAVDLAVGNRDTNTIVFLENDGNGNFTPANGGADSGLQLDLDPITLDPLDGDGDKDFDLVSGNWDFGAPQAAIAVIINNDGDDTFTIVENIPVGEGPIDLANGDLDGNGFRDIVSSNRGDGSASVILNNGPALGNGETPTFEAAITLLVGADPQSVDVADFDGDGDPDIAVTAVDLLEGPSVQVIENLLDETDEPEFEPPVAVDVIGDPVFVVNGDMDGNGLPDIVTANNDEDVPDDGSVTVVLSIPEVFCDTDFDGSGETDFGDLLTLLGNWGRCTDEVVCPGDINADSEVDFADLLLLIQGFGACE